MNTSSKRYLEIDTNRPGVFPADFFMPCFFVVDKLDTDSHMWYNDFIYQYQHRKHFCERKRK